MNQETIEITEKMRKMCNDFQDEYGEILLLRSNIAAINRLLIKRGKEKELYQEIKNVIDEFKNNS